MKYMYIYISTWQANVIYTIQYFTIIYYFMMQTGKKKTRNQAGQLAGLAGAQANLAN